jgi:hypothetical protein
MGTTNDELKEILERQGGETNTRLLSIETHLATLNGSVAANTKAIGRNAEDIADLPCTEHGKTLTRVATLLEASPSPREMGRMEERQEVHKTALQRVWDIGKIPIVMIVTALVTFFLSQVIL